MNKIKKLLLASFIVLSILSVGCTIVKEVPTFEDDKEPLICTKEYNPVCGIDGNTYSNPCMAGDVQIDYEGECDLGDENNSIEPHICTEEEKAAQMCTMEYAPVCGSDGKTYGNGCGACSAGVESWTLGEC